MLYPQLLKHDFERLPRPLREFHSAPGGGRASGTASVRHASGLLARLIRFPPSGEKIPLQLQVVASENEERWIRQFNDFVLQSVQRRSGDLLLEVFGPVRLFFRIFADEKGMRFECQRARLWMIPLPLRVMAIERLDERGDERSWSFEVTVPSVGSYRGTMVALL